MRKERIRSHLLYCTLTGTTVRTSTTLQLPEAQGRNKRKKAHLLLLYCIVEKKKCFTCDLSLREPFSSCPVYTYTYVGHEGAFSVFSLMSIAATAYGGGLLIATGQHYCVLLLCAVKARLPYRYSVQLPMLLFLSLSLSLCTFCDCQKLTGRWESVLAKGNFFFASRLLLS